MERDLLATLSRMRISTTEIEFIGNGYQAAGTYANVAVATLVRVADKGNDSGKRVAVKMFRFIMREDMTEEKFLRIFVNELRLLDKLSHPNIAKIIGFVEDVEKSIAWLIFPWEDNGNLREFLRSGTWEIPERVSLILDVASGLEYLHSRQPPVCHGDLKSLNILVNSSNRAVITDFGSARILRQTQELNPDAGTRLEALASSAFPKNSGPPQFTVTASETALTLTGPACSLRWAPPEVLNGEALDLAGDIWALGWIAWEALTDDYPFGELKLDFEVTMRIIEGRLPSIYGHDQLSQVRSLCSLMQSCWKPEPKERPSATECLKTLRWIPNAIPTTNGGEESKLQSVVLLRQIGDMHRVQNRHEEASKMYEEGLSIARSTGDQTMVANLLVELARNQRGRFDSVNVAKAEALVTEALTIFKRIGDDLGRASALRILGHFQVAQLKYAEAEASFTEALAIYRRTGNDTLGQASTLFALGNAQRVQSTNLEAESSFMQALAIYERLGNQLGRANALQMLGDVRQARSEDVEAETVYSQALTIYESIGNDRGRVNSAIGLSQLRFRQARYGEAKALINGTAGISERLNYTWAIKISKMLLERILEAGRRSVEP
ncbi:hypothetical protein M407DRAFT_32524 [Tulasnella calospora MUT 4182]|uniref:Protein kinase domain-containing protein n=1 Tax=Tulasnella calospora MUT 4182 TaxID=1051891 RepID=A0A0C3L8G9_9AGAM|nr:hypothetical protein M407DRAFT_32524 [Tulasnella calospora MUT 4182]